MGSSFTETVSDSFTIGAMSSTSVTVTATLRVAIKVLSASVARMVMS